MAPGTPPVEGEERRRSRRSRQRQRERQRAQEPQAPVAAEQAEAGSAAAAESTRAVASEASAFKPVETAVPAAPAARAVFETPAEPVMPVESEPSMPMTAATEPDEAPLPSAEQAVAKVVSEATTVPDEQPPAMPEPVVRVESPIPSETQHPPATLAAESPTLAVDAKAYLGEAGLELVETDPSKAASTQPEPDSVKLGRVRPERPREVDEELVQVETRK
jgi:transcription termination factor Rho